jgi:hypothetical protein
MKYNALISQQRAAAVYNVPKSTLCTRRAKTTLQHNSHPNLLRLTRPEEETVMQYIKKLDAQGFAPTLSYICKIAN